MRVLATSREGLDVADEQIWPVRSLEVDAAADLFIARAHSVAPGFTADDADAVMEICRRLDGIPLAIELAASRISSMTLDDVRDRLDRRFKLLVGSRRSLERHQTLRHAVQWSYDLLDDAEKALLERCSVFAGGFEIQSVCAVAGSDDPDDFAVMDLLHSLVRKSLLVVDRSAGRIRFSMLETIRQFAEEQLVAGGEADSVRTAHTRHFADREAEILALWDSPRQRESYTWFFTELANLRTAFRWGADRGDLDAAATIATYAGILAFMVENHEPVAWAEELIETARAVDHPRLASLYVVAALSWIAGESMTRSPTPTPVWRCALRRARCRSVSTACLAAYICSWANLRWPSTGISPTWIRFATRSRPPGQSGFSFCLWWDMPTKRWLRRPISSKLLRPREIPMRSPTHCLPMATPFATPILRRHWRQCGAD